MGVPEILILLIVAGALLSMIRAFVVPRNLGIVAGEAGMTQLFAGLVRSPDVLYASWDRLPEAVRAGIVAMVQASVKAPRDTSEILGDPTKCSGPLNLT